MGGDYARAVSLTDTAINDLDAPRADELGALRAFWDLMQYAQGDGLLHYDEDLQIVLPAGPMLAQPEVKSAEARRLLQQADALVNLATVSAILVMTTDRLPFFETIVKQAVEQLRQAFCAGETFCAEAALLAIPLLARHNGGAAGYELGAALAQAFADAGNGALSAWAWIRAGDAALDPMSSAFDLGLRPLNTMDSTMAMNAGRVVEEFQPATRAALDRARDAYASARGANADSGSARVAAHLLFRAGLLAWRGADHAGAWPAMVESVGQLRAAGNPRDAFRAAGRYAC